MIRGFRAPPVILAALLLVVACKKPTWGSSAPDAASSAIAEDALDGGSTVAAERIAEDAAARVPAAPDDRKAAISALVSGAANAAALPESATDRGVAFSPTLRKRLTTVTVSSAAMERGEITLGDISALLPISDGERITAGLRPRIRGCYRSGLLENPVMEGKLVIEATVSPSGSVTEATATSNAGISPTVVSCVTGVFKRAQYAAPGGNGSKLTVALKFDLSPL